MPIAKHQGAVDDLGSYQEAANRCFDLIDKAIEKAKKQNQRVIYIPVEDLEKQAGVSRWIFDKVKDHIVFIYTIGGWNVLIGTQSPLKSCDCKFYFRFS